jgi:hypothetical protein
MKEKLLIIFVLLLLSGIFVFLDYTFHHHFFLHLAAIPLEIILAVIVVEHFLARKEKANKKNQLFLIKSYLFRSEMKNLFACNLISLKSPEISISKIRTMTLKELEDFRSNMGDLTYKSPLHLEKVIQEYVKAKNVFQFFLNWAIEHKIEDIFDDMIYILHFIQDVTLFNEQNPDKLFIDEAKSKPELLEKTSRVVRNGVDKLMDYMVELKQNGPVLLDNLLSDYEISCSIHPAEHISNKNLIDCISLEAH